MLAAELGREQLPTNSLERGKTTEPVHGEPTEPVHGEPTEPARTDAADRAQSDGADSAAAAYPTWQPSPAAVAKASSQGPGLGVQAHVTQPALPLNIPNWTPSGSAVAPTPPPKSAATGQPLQWMSAPSLSYLGARSTQVQRALPEDSDDDVFYDACS